jgi:hypothetical protein
VFAPDLYPLPRKHEKYSSFNRSSFQMKTRVLVAEAIVKAFALRNLTPATVLEGYGKIINADIADCYDEKGGARSVHDIPEDTRFAIVGISPGEFGVEFKLSDKKAALDAIAKASGMFKDRVEVSGPDGGPVEVSPGERLVDQLEQLRKKLSSEEGSA